MSILSKTDFEKIKKSYRRSHKSALYEITSSGICENAGGVICNLPPLVNTRAHALNESIRWGEPCTFFLMPNVLSWIVPLVRDGVICGGLSGGEVMTEEDRDAPLEIIHHLTANGVPHSVAKQYVSQLPVWNQKEPQKAAEFLFSLTYYTLNWNISLLIENRKKTLRQQEIAEEIHRRKRGIGSRTLMEDERTLISLMRAGDQKGARRELNKTLGALFSHTADIRLLKAHVIEMMGYLVRNALEESPQMSTLIEKNHVWMAAIIDAHDFETLSNVVADSLDDFMRNIYLHGQNRTNHTVARILDYLGENFQESVTLKMISEEVNLSTFRISHLVKETTGKTVMQHVHQLRVQEAQRLLEESDLSCTDIAYEAGFGDQSYFIKQFRKWMGITPARYRKVYQSRKSTDQHVHLP